MQKGHLFIELDKDLNKILMNKMWAYDDSANRNKASAAKTRRCLKHNVTVMFRMTNFVRKSPQSFATDALICDQLKSLLNS